MNITPIHIGSRLKVDAKNIKLLVSDINYTTIFFVDGTKVLVSTTMGIIEKRLPLHIFFRVNRRTIINRSAVQQYYIRPMYDEVELKDASRFKVSRRRKENIRASLATASHL